MTEHLQAVIQLPGRKKKIQVDARIADLIVNMNQVGFSTEFSCEGILRKSGDRHLWIIGYCDPRVWNRALTYAGFRAARQPGWRVEINDAGHFILDIPAENTAAWKAAIQRIVDEQKSG